MSNIPRRLAWFVGSITTLAGLCLAGSVLLAARASPKVLPADQLAAIVGLAVAGIVLRLEIRIGSHRWVLAWSDTALVLALLLVPVPWAVLLSTVGKAAGSGVTFHRHQPIKLIYNTAAHTVAAALAAITAVTVSSPPFDAHLGRDVLALLIAGAVYDLTCEALTVAVIAVANNSRPITVWRAGLGLATLTMIGNLAVTAGVLALAGINSTLILVLPVAALVLQRAYREAQRGRTDRRSSQQLTDAIAALGHLDEATILSRTACHAAALLSADRADIVLRTNETAPEQVQVFSSSAPAPGAGPWWTETFDISDQRQNLTGELWLYFPRPVRLTVRERGMLSALAAVARNALTAGRAHADAERLAAALSHEMTHDSLTTLPTRQLLVGRIDAYLDGARRNEAPALGLILIGLNDFGEVSRTLGHDAREELLRHAADRLRHAATAAEFVAQLEDSQFAVFIEQIHEPHDMRARADSLLTAVATPVRIDAGTVVLEAAAGLACARPSAIDSAELIRQATVALAASRRANISTDYYRAGEDTQAGPNALLLTAELKKALRQDELILQYQPILDLTTGQPVAAEALVRWIHPDRGLVLPERFAAVLEQPSLIRPYTDWLLHKALADRQSWLDIDPAVPVSVNLPARCLLDSELPSRVRQALLSAGLQPPQLMLEFTESETLGAVSTMDAVLAELHAHGVRIAVDNFGSSLASLSRLTRLPATDLKIAPELIDRMTGSPQARAIVRAAREIADSVGLRVIAVGARTTSHLLAARDAGAHAAQGSAISGALMPTKVYAFLLERSQDTRKLTSSKVIPLRPRDDDL